MAAASLRSSSFVSSIELFFFQVVHFLIVKGMDSSDVNGLEGDAYAMDRYSRQIGAYGVEAMAKLVKMKVLVVGLNGVGIESAKNLVLAGPGAITLVDDTIVAPRHLGTNFYLSEKDIGNTTRASACAPHLQALNRLVVVSVCPGEVNEGLVLKHTVMVCCGMNRDEAIEWNSFCRAHSIGFILSDVCGLFGYCFVDLGDNFQVRDKNGEQPVSRIIDGIENVNDNQLIVHLIPSPDGRRHNMEDSNHDGWIEFDEVEGDLGIFLKENGPFRVSHVYNDRIDPKTSKSKKVFDAYSLGIQHNSVFPKYSGGGGTITQVKKPEHVAFRSLEKNLIQPISPGDFQLMFTDGTKFGRGEQLHCALQGLWEFQCQHNGGNFPETKMEVDQVILLAKKRNELLSKEKNSNEEALTLDALDDDVLRMAVTFSACDFQPLACFFGGIVAQEVIKMTGKFSPLNQWLHLDCFEVLPEVLVDTSNPEAIIPTEAERKRIGSRYDDLIVIFGRKFHTKLTQMSTFMVGCGALGCELLKNFAMIGIACDPDGIGTITVTDNDTIEVSNLSRQFLFREHNVGQSKSIAASEAAVQMNPHIHIRALEHLVAPHTEKIFNDMFWESQDFVTNALDNVKARMYVDGQCVFHQKPLLESGTLGTKCNVQVVVPFLTQSYSDGPKDNDDGDSIPMCTLRNFPSQIEHCIEWARARFNDLFTTAATEASNFSERPQHWLDELRKKTLDLPQESRMRSAVETELGPLREIVEMLNQCTSPDNTFAACLREAYLLFHRMYRDKTDSLISTYPQDAKDNQGNPFWSGTKRFPQSAHFNAEEPVHLEFVMSTANLLAVNFGLQPVDQPVGPSHPWRSALHVKELLSTLTPPEAHKETVDMSGGGEEDASVASMEVDDDAAIREFEALLQELTEMIPHMHKLTVEPAEFEKDADWNFHIDFITAASNLRAWNYRLKPVTRHKCKMIAGKIIPAVATTTASVTGLVMIEMLKVLQGGKKLGAFKDSSNNLGVNAYFFSEPSEPVKAKDEYDPIEMSEVICRPPKFTKWDQTKVDSGSLTLFEFLAVLNEQVGLVCTGVSHASANQEDAQGKGKFAYERDAWPKSMMETYKKRMSDRLEDIVFQVYGDAAITDVKKRVVLDVSMEDEDGNAFKIPEVVYIFKK